MNLTVQDLLRQDAKNHDLYFNISGMELSITSLFSVQIVSNLWASDTLMDSYIHTKSSIHIIPVSHKYYSRGS